MNDFDQPLEGEMLPASTMGRGGALEQIQRAEVDVQISTAHAYPRDADAARKKIRATALRDQTTASECFYSLERMNRATGKKTAIHGPSVRLAEIIASSWGNLRVYTRLMDIGRTEIRVAAHCHDLESNMAYTVEVTRRITTRDGKRFGDDLVQVTIAAASAIAFRNAILKVVPQAEWKAVFQEAMNMQARPRGEPARPGQPAADPRQALEASRQRCLETFAELGVSVNQILWKVNRESVGEITKEDLTILKGVLNAINQEATTVEEAFGEGEVPEPQTPLEKATRGQPGPAAGPPVNPPPDRQPGEE